MTARTRRSVLFAGCFCGLLFVPWPDPAPPVPAAGTAFAWKRDSLWQQLESRFSEARRAGCERMRDSISFAFAAIRDHLDSLEVRPYHPGDPLLSGLEREMFNVAPDVAACPDSVAAYLQLTTRARTALKRQSRSWDVASPAVRSALYRLMYGGRTAVEEILLQSSPGTVPALLRVDDVPSATPRGLVLDMPVHSGDILVSRGGAPTSALIARGSDFPGNFSHVALVYVDAVAGRTWIVEAHIERGVAIADVDAYVRDTKLRVMVLRLRPDTPAMTADPQLPHRAAEWMYHEALRHHIPYDFSMDDRDPGQLFCSEVVSQAYHRAGVTLWTGRSRISSAGTAAMLAAFGVRHFETEEPADLEYDPQLSVVAEWRDPSTLFKDHLDNAVIDAMLERADEGERLGYDWYMLPLARCARAYSVVLNLFGGVGPVPEGMDAAAALRHAAFDRRFAAVKAGVLVDAARFRAAKGYAPPYWELVRMARRAAH